MDVKIVPMADEYIPGFYRCLDAVARERKYLAFLAAPPFEAVRSYVLSNPERNVLQFVALADGEVVGWIDITPQSFEGFTHSGELGMGVHKEHRGRGIGSQLIEKALRAAQEAGLERVELEVYESNTPAVRLYEKYGFETEGLKKKARKLDGQYDNIVLIALIL